MGNGIILFSGVHGVGKGYFIKENIKDNDNIICVSASELIRQYRNSEDAGYKKVKDVEGNQEILLDALRRMVMSVDKSILLDGHLCIINSNSEVETISDSFISKAQMKGIILLQEEIPIIEQRQKARDGLSLSAEMIREIQCKEKLYAELLFKKYKIPFEIISSECRRDQFLKIINTMKEGA